jgi:hypothetical protein
MIGTRSYSRPYSVQSLAILIGNGMPEIVRCILNLLKGLVEG